MAENQAVTENQTPNQNQTLWEKLSHGQRAVAVELDPPTDENAVPFMEDARVLYKAGADVITIADSPMGRPRIDSCLLACKIKREIGAEVLPHMACRDRNWTAIQAMLMGLSMEEIRQVLFVTGDPIPAEYREHSRVVFHFNSRELTRRVMELQETLSQPPFRIFGALNVNARYFDRQLQAAREKEACGMIGFLTQPVLSRAALNNLKRARETLHGKLLGGIFPVISYRNAAFLNDHVPGIRVSEEILSMYEGKNREEGEQLALELALKTARDIEPWTDGLYLMTPFRRVSLMSAILDGLSK